MRFAGLAAAAMTAALCMGSSAGAVGTPVITFETTTFEDSTPGGLVLSYTPMLIIGISYDSPITRTIKGGGPTGNYLSVIPTDVFKTVQFKGIYFRDSDTPPNETYTELAGLDFRLASDGYYSFATKGPGIAVKGGEWVHLDGFGTTPFIRFVSAGGVDFDNIKVQLASSPVPEPASWAMMIAGFGIAGGALRRRRYPRTAPTMSVAARISPLMS